ncbi:MAG: hypothetical protein OEZ02_01230 [Anaerolineae bacterium]|nr:hypothetical protein [Anaerolineae bacterium]
MTALFGQGVGENLLSRTPIASLTEAIEATLASGTAQIPGTGTPTATQSQPPTPTVGYTPPPTGPTMTAVDGGGPILRSGPSVAAVFFSPPPPIDGYVSDWPGSFNTASNVVFGEGYFSGEADLSVQFKIAWDNSYVFLAAVVKDNKFVQEASGPALYRGDSIEFTVDTQVSRDYADSELDYDDFQLGISPGDFQQTAPEAYVWYPASKRGALPAAILGAVQTADGYILEAAIPWSVFGVVPAVSQHFGFSFSVSDNDAPGYEWQQSMLSNVPGRYWSDPTTWGDIVLILP